MPKREKQEQEDNDHLQDLGDENNRNKSHNGII